ncbi:hypothetical protein RSSE_c3364 [Ralstonia solanacearum]|nr:hypothetical protein RSSE_c3364 [Ralstonia solanacearum]
MNLSRMSIKTRLTLGFGALAVCVVVVSALSLRALSESTQGFSGFVQAITARATLANNMRTAVDRRAIAARNLVLVVKPQDLEMEKAEVLRAHEEVQAQLAQLKAMADDGRNVSEQARALAEAIDRVEARYGPVATGIVQLTLDGKRDEAIQKMDDECRPLLVELIQATTAYARYTRERQEQLVAADEAQYGQQRSLLIALSIAAVLVAIGAGVLITRSITRPIGKAVNVAETVARGDLGSRIDAEGTDETSHRLAALADMNTRLTQIVDKVRDSSGSIAGAARPIAAGNADLSQRTEAQASSPQETAAGMEELTSTVKQNADNAQHATELAATASEVAQKGNAVVSQVVSTMQDISDRSGKIAEITSIIEGIAFQTNILALNAAVEAARAGDQGRGFAVVANEVRSLAQRSAKAAKEIKRLIASSVERIHDGSTLATRYSGSRR